MARLSSFALVLAAALAPAAATQAQTRDPVRPPADAPASIYADGVRAPSARGASGRGRTGAPARPTLPAAPPASPGLAFVGDAAPQCRSRCAGAFYSCRSGDGDACGSEFGVCRAACDVSSPEPGRLVSPLPAAGLGAAEPFRRLSSAPTPEPPRQ